MNGVAMCGAVSRRRKATGSTREARGTADHGQLAAARRVLSAALLVILALLVGCGGGSDSTAAPAAILNALALEPTTVSTPAGTMQAFKAVGTYSDGTTKVLSAASVPGDADAGSDSGTGSSAPPSGVPLQWTSSDNAVATVDATGIATGVKAGVATITATEPTGGLKGTATLTVTNAILKSIAITPPAPSIPAGTTQQLVATGTYSDASTKDLSATATWNSADPTVATVDNTGKATGVTPGAVDIRATDAASGVTAGVKLTVTSAVLKAIAVTPTTVSLPSGTAQQLTATGTYSDGSTKDLTASVGWTSSDEKVAMVALGRLTAVAPGMATVTATDAASMIKGTSAITVTAAALRAVAVAPTNPSIPNGTTQQILAIGTYTDGTTRDITTSVTWTSSAPAVATVSNAAPSQGLVTGVTPGATLITATDPASKINAATTVTVTAAILKTIAVTPTSPSVPNGSLQQMTATGTYSDGSTKDVTTSVTWTSSNATVASVSNAAGTQGILTATGAGSTIVTATMPTTTIAGSTTVTVTAATLKSISITPTSASIPNGTTQAYVATGTYSDSSVRNITTSVTWSTSDPKTATVSNAAGSQGVATGVGAGSTTITATDAASGVSGATTLTITSAVLKSIAVSPTTTRIPNGTRTAFNATGTYSDGSTRDLTAAVTWTSLNAGVATISNAAGTKGIATGINPGRTTISAADPTTGISSTATLTVTSAALVSLSVSPATPTLPKGSTQQFTATGTFTDGSSGDVTSSVTWSSSDNTILSVSNASSSRGLATASATGSVTLTATDPSSGIAGSTTVTVSSAVLRSVSIAPSAPTIPKGTTQSFVATGSYSDGSTRDITTQVTWASANPAVATISNAAPYQGVATGTGAGTTAITATDPSTGLNASVVLTVTSAKLVSVAVTPASTTIPNGTTQAFTATATYSDGSRKNLTTAVTWSSSDVTIATISNSFGTNGIATGNALGTVTITAAVPASAITGTTTLTVGAAALSAITLTPVNATIPNGTTHPFTATGRYTDGSSADLTASVTWASSNSATATISSAGVATAVAVGTTTISAKDAASTITGTTNLRVTAASITAVTVSPATSSVAPGLNTSFTATATYSDGSKQDVTQLGSWTTSNPVVASVSDTPGTKGIANGRTAGAANITVSYFGKTASSALTVKTAMLVGVTPNPSTIKNGASLQYVAVATFSDGSTLEVTGNPLTMWTSSNTGKASVSSTGYATAKAAGALNISASYAGASGSSALTVLP